MSLLLRATLLVPLLLSAACGGEGSDAGPSDAGSNDAGSNDAGSNDAGTPDAAANDAGNNDAGTNDAGSNDAGSIELYGFSIRVPQAHMVACSGSACTGGSIMARDVDYVCNLVWGSFNHYVYVQAHPDRYLDFMGFLYAVDGAWLSDGSQVTSISAIYDWGGNHHNDSLTVDVGSQVVVYDHSSFGFGFRQCQPMDCLKVYAPGPGAELANGCGRDRTVPTTCVKVADDGSVPALVDMFARCPGDT